MELTPAAEAIHAVFYELDYAIMAFYHALAEGAGGVFTPLMNAISWTGWKGAMLIALSLIMILFKKTRKTGVCAFLALAIGAIFTNIAIKNIVARPRPYNFSEDIRTWWIMVGQPFESEFSFPSGHVTAATGFSLACCYVNGKKYLPFAALYIFLMCVSRNYLMVHYPSDVLGAAIVGACAATLSYLIVSFIWKKIEKKPS